jgi:REP element-mobilizing transposase RayT
MSNPILVASPNPNFGSLIQKSIELTGDWEVYRTQSGKEALQWGKSHVISLAILDSGLRDTSLPALIAALRSTAPEMKIALIIPGRDPRRFDSAPADAFLTMPFQSADLLDLLDLIRGQNTKKEESRARLIHDPPIPTNPPSSGSSWLEDASRAAQYLTRLSLESGSLAALILKNGELWAYAGSLLEAGANELAQAIARDWASNGGIDMARFVRLPSSNEDYMVYATNLADQKVLAVIYDAETPFSKIRSETGKLAKALVTAPQVEVEQNPIRPSEWCLEYQGEVPPEPDERLEQALASLPPLFDDAEVPPPTVQTRGEEETIEVQKDRKLEVPGLTTDFVLPEISSDRIEPIPGFEAVGPGEPVPISSQVRNSESGRTPFPGQQPVSQLPEPAWTAFSDLVLACVIIPRLPKHRLVGDMAASLQRWLGEICLSYGWRLEGLQIQTDALVWTVKVAPSTSPIQHIRTIRQLTSKYIYEDFPRIGRENPSGDFWAPGYLVTSSPRLPTIQVVQAFIQQTRQRQGISSKQS